MMFFFMFFTFFFFMAFNFYNCDACIIPRNFKSIFMFFTWT